MKIVGNRLWTVIGYRDNTLLYRCGEVHPGSKSKDSGSAQVMMDTVVFYQNAFTNHFPEPRNNALDMEFG
jgi:hypothetical protein